MKLHRPEPEPGEPPPNRSPGLTGDSAPRVSPPSSRSALAKREAGRPIRVLVVDDDPMVARSLVEFLRADGFAAAAAPDGQAALEAMSAAAGGAAATATHGSAAESASGPFGVVICDLSMPRIAGLDLIKRLAKEYPAAAVVVLTGYGSIDSAVEAVRLGAVDYLTKPVVDRELRFALERAVRQHTLLAENQALKTQLDGRFGLDSIVGSDHRMVRIFDLIQAVAPSKTTVLMTGESGVGKSLVAHAIHRLSPRRDKPFVELACGSIPETLLESELFGHMKGAFTGAHADKPGKFLAADGGTIFLDEINSASPGMQLKLLRVLQERRFEPVGSNQTIEVDVRVVLASNQPLEAMVADGRFRQDLYYRINVVKIELPPLRERTSDVGVLAGHFLRKHAAELGRQIVGFSDEAAAALVRYSYPGNVRELQNIVERAAVLTRSSTIGIEDLPEHVVNNSPGLLMPAWLRGGARATPSGPAAPGSNGATPGPGAPGHAGAGGMAMGPGLGGPGSETAASGGRSGVPGEAPRAHPAGEHFGAGARSSPPAGAVNPGSPAPTVALDEALRESERRIILAALQAHAWNRRRTADALRINRTTLYKKMKQLKIEEERGERMAS